MNDFTKDEMNLMRQGKTSEVIEKKREIYLTAIKEGKLEYAFIDSCRIVDGKNVCPCGGAPFPDRRKSEHTKSKRHIKYMGQTQETQETQNTALPLPTTTDEIQEIPKTDNETEPTPEIVPPSTDTPLTKAEIRKQKKADYMRVYMRGYHAKRYNEDPEYRQYRINMTKKGSCNMNAKYVKSYQYIKEHNINLFDEKGN